MKPETMFSTSKISVTFLLAVAFLSLLPQSTDAVSCFKCEPENKDCADPFNAKESKVAICTGNYCIKSKVTSGSVSAVGRDCASESKLDGCVSMTLLDVPTTVCSCKTDHCNGSVGLKSQSLLALVVVGLSVIGVFLTTKM